jgi:hypothetical protein
MDILALSTLLSRARISVVPELVSWLQEAKAEAMGPRHSTATLSSVAAEPWLSVVRRDASKGADAGWFWQYKLNSIKACPASPLLDSGHYSCYIL